MAYGTAQNCFCFTLTIIYDTQTYGGRVLLCGVWRLQCHHRIASSTVCDGF
ncbi:hypothetical protein HanRHA438_Chr09g0427721 [Helianthus annuus]|nr:hypothetical protein HanRHA438_Chr09g0427721 [Helianthus annuus]